MALWGGVKLLLGVAFDWSIYKGLDVFIRLANELDESYGIVLVGVTEEMSFTLPKRIITIKRTQSKEELAQIYTAADYLINPTREDNFPTVNIEALACGTPVITFNTNGSPEIIDKSCGAVVPYNDYEEMKKTIERLSNPSPFSSRDCVNRAQQFSMGRKFEEYGDLYGG
jgi:putative colanic acid biosynthesis glycosyltransferase